MMMMMMMMMIIIIIIISMYDDIMVKVIRTWKVRGKNCAGYNCSIKKI